MTATKSLLCLHGRAFTFGRGLINSEARALTKDHHAVVALGGLRRDIAIAHVDEHALSLARERVAMAAAAGRIEAEDVAGLERIVRVARRQALGVVAIRIDPDVAGATGPAAGTAVRRDHVLHGADREAGVLEIEIFAADAESAAEPPGAAGVLDQLEADKARRE